MKVFFDNLRGASPVYDVSGEALSWDGEEWINAIIGEKGTHVSGKKIPIPAMSDISLIAAKAILKLNKNEGSILISLCQSIVSFIWFEDDELGSIGGVTRIDTFIIEAIENDNNNFLLAYQTMNC